MREREKLLFGENHNYCKWCGRPIPVELGVDMCAGCQEDQVFREIRDYVRENDVNEYELAEIFDIPMRQVKQWIREGRLEYKVQEKKMGHLYCQRCGREISFGKFCEDCNRILYGVKGGYDAQKQAQGEEQIRFYNKNKK